MLRKPFAAAALLASSLFGAGPVQADAPSLPADVTLTQVLGFRPRPGLEEVFVIRNNHYLAKGTKVRLLDSDPAFGTEGAFCRAEALGHSGYIRCDKPEAFKFKAAAAPKKTAARGAPPAQAGRASSPPAGQSSSRPKAKKVGLGAYCSGVDDCHAFCTKSCKLDLSKWRSTCNFPAGLGGSIAEGSSELKKLPKMKLVSGASSVRATDDVIAGLQRLDSYISSSASWPRGYTVYALNCYRSDKSDSTSECDYILKGWHIKAKWSAKKPSTPAEKSEKANGDRMVNPPANLGLMWPGATPHSAGLGCDLVVHDQSGKEATTCKMTDNARQKAASKALVDALTNDKVGAVRLNFEGWHFEWGGAITACRCKGDDCNLRHWPTPCDGGQHCGSPR